MPQPIHPAARGHLRLASASAPRRASERRLLLFLRALLTAAVLAWLTVVAWVSAAFALAPLGWRRAPRGSRLRPLRREARVIPFQPRQEKAAR